MAVTVDVSTVENSDTVTVSSGVNGTVVERRELAIPIYSPMEIDIESLQQAEPSKLLVSIEQLTFNSHMDGHLVPAVRAEGKTVQVKLGKLRPTRVRISGAHREKVK